LIGLKSSEEAIGLLIIIFKKSAGVPALVVKIREKLFKAFPHIPQEEQLFVLQVLQTFPAPATTRPSLCAAKSEIVREVFSLWQFVQRIGASASLIERRASNFLLQSRQMYS
jgi:hypothetical protein